MYVQIQYSIPGSCSVAVRSKIKDPTTQVTKLLVLYQQCGLAGLAQLAFWPSGPTKQKNLDEASMP